MNPTLVPVDLSLAEKHELPGIDKDKHYLVRRNGHLYFGKFQRVWFGWNFQCGFGASGGFQFDAPGYNHSTWEAVWELRWRDG